MQMSADDTNSGKFGHGSKAHKRERLIAALLIAPNHATAAEQCGLSLSTVQRWLRDPEFVEAFRQAKVQLVSDTTTQLRVAGTEAVATLLQIARNQAVQPPARVSASRALLEFLYEGYKLEEVESRMDEMKKKAEQQSVTEEIEDVRRKLLAKIAGRTVAGIA